MKKNTFIVHNNESKRLLQVARRESGFSLVELMVALVIGLVILLGAGQLFLTTLQNFQTVGHLSVLQSSVQFASDVLVRDTRRAGELWLNEDQECEDGDAIVCFEGLADRDGQDGCEPGDVMRKEYKLSDSPAGSNNRDGYELMQRQDCGGGDGWEGWEPIVAGFASDGLVVERKGVGVYLIRLCLVRLANDNQPDLSECAGEEWLDFNAVNRREAFNAANGGSS